MVRFSGATDRSKPYTALFWTGPPKGTRMKPLLACLLVLAGCSAQRKEIPAPQAETALESAGEANEVGRVQDLGTQLNKATPFSKSLADQFGIGNATATPAAPDHQPPAEKKTTTAKHATTK